MKERNKERYIYYTHILYKHYSLKNYNINSNNMASLSLSRHLMPCILALKTP